MRLQKFLARAGVASRRGSENLMTAGRVSVNGEIVQELGSKLDPDVDVVEVDGKRVWLSDGSVYLILNKPAGYLTTMSDPHGRPTVAELMPVEQYPGLFPVGRLDMDTTGLLLFTTDGDFGNNLLHPRYKIEKTYLVRIESNLEDSAKVQLENGLELEDGLTQPAKIEILSTQENSLVSITIREGRKRQVKRMFEAVDHPVLQLHRSAFGGLELGNLEAGEYRHLTEEEIGSLKCLTETS